MKGSVLAVAAAVAVAANSATFTDRAGDVREAPDVRQIAISNDDAGIITVRVTAPPGPAGAAYSEIGFGVDADQNPDTGALEYGAEFMMDLFGVVTPRFFRPPEDGRRWTPAENPASYTASYDGRVATFTFKASEVGLTPTSGFNIFGFTYVTGDVDTAPEVRTFNYQQVAGTRPPALGPDTRAPFAEAIPSMGVHGKRAELDYEVLEGRGRTAETIRIYRGRKLLKMLNLSMSDTNPFFTYFAPWKVPKKMKGQLRFCVTAVDRAGNRSNRSCAPLTIE